MTSHEDTFLGAENIFRDESQMLPLECVLHCSCTCGVLFFWALSLSRMDEGLSGWSHLLYTVLMFLSRLEHARPDWKVF